MKENKITCDKEILNNLINVQKLSYEEIGKQFNCTGSYIRKYAKHLNIELPVRRNINKKETFNKGNHIIYKENNLIICKNCGKEFISYDSHLSKYCSNHCQKEYEHKILYNKILTGDESIMRANYSPVNFKKDILNEQNNVCAICGMKQIWNDKPLVFILDHIDGNAANNKRDNLRCICPNCDSQLDTYKSKNKNSARNQYRYKK